jgi:hypothetical protein
MTTALSLLTEAELFLGSIVSSPYVASHPSDLREAAADGLRAMRDHARLLVPAVGESHYAAYSRASRATILHRSGFRTFSAMLPKH